MDKDKLYSEMVDMVPVKSDGTDSFRKTITKKLNDYQILIKDLDKKDCPKEWEKTTARVKQLCDGINRAVESEYRGMRHSSYASIKNQLDGYERPNVTIEKLAFSNNIKTIPANSVFYRMREVSLQDRYNLERKELFHIPMDKKGLVKTQRFSVPGFPCLYLSSRVYGCWEEMGRPDFGTIMVSKFVSQIEFKVLDLRVPSKDIWEKDMVNYTSLFPLVIASMVPVKNSSDSYKPEYLIPQLITEWIISQNKGKKDPNKDIIGVLFTSTHKNKEEFNFPDDYYDNYAIPVLKPMKSKDYCNKLAEMFKLTAPTYYDLEVLKQGQNIDMGSYDENIQEEENYRISPFGIMEKYLDNLTVNIVNK